MKLTSVSSQTASSIALGCMRLSSLAPSEVGRIIEEALENGINFFDHADIYGGGQSESLFGEYLSARPELRSKILIQDKCGICSGYYDASAEHILSSVDASLKRLHTDYLDVLLLHRPDALMEPEEVASAFEALHRAGKVRFFGVSNMNAGQLALLDAAMPGRLVVNQLQLGIAHCNLIAEGINVNTDADQAVERTGQVLDYCRLKGIQVQAWSPLQFGMFSGPFLTSPLYQPLNARIQSLADQYAVQPEAIAIAWILRHPAHIQVICGSMNPARLRSLCRAEAVHLPRPEWYELYKLAGNPLP